MFLNTSLFKIHAAYLKKKKSPWHSKTLVLVGVSQKNSCLIFFEKNRGNFFLEILMYLQIPLKIVQISDKYSNDVKFTHITTRK